MCSVKSCEKNVTMCRDHFELNKERHNILRTCIDWADRVRPQPVKQHLHQKNGDNLSCEAVCQPSILQEWYAHEESKVEVESKQVNNSQITKSRILFTNEHGFKKDEEGHTQGRDTPPDTRD